MPTAQTARRPRVAGERPAKDGRRTVAADVALTRGLDATSIDTAFDPTSESGGYDADTYSPTLARYHQLLWSKPLPDGTEFTLTTGRRAPFYLEHHSTHGHFVLASDCMYPDSTGTHSIGGRILFPALRVDGKITLNGQRGFHPRIGDRMDLTLECIRRFYRGDVEPGSNPLSTTLVRYADFFDLFGTFNQYVDFWLLQDLVAPDYQAVKTYLPFDDFRWTRRTATADELRTIARKETRFVDRRRRRIAMW